LATAGIGLNELINTTIPANVRSGLGLQDRSLLTPSAEKLDIPNLGLRVENGKIVRGGGASTRAAAAAAKAATGGAGRARRAAGITFPSLSASELITSEFEGEAEMRAITAALASQRDSRRRLTAALGQSEDAAFREDRLGQGRLSRAALTLDFEERENAAEKAEKGLKALEKTGALLGANQRFARGFAETMLTVGDAFERFGSNVAGAFTNIRTLFDSLKRAVLGFFNDILGSALQNLVRGTLGGLFGNLGGSLGNLFRTQPTFPASVSGAGSVAAAALPNIGSVLGGGGGGTISAASGAAGGGGFLSGLFGGAGGALLPLLGGSFGSSLGGKSTFGNILGGIGGGAVGLGVSFGASVFGAGGGLAAASLAALGPIALIGAPLLIGGLLLGKAKQRRSDEQASGEFLRQALDSLEQLRAGIASGSIDGSQAASIFESQILGTFRQQISGLKTGSVVSSRLQNQVADLRGVYDAIIPPAIAQQAQARATSASNALRFSRQIPEFASGGTTLGGMALLHAGEKVVNLTQQATMRAIAGPNIFERAGVPGLQHNRIFDNGGTMPAGGWSSEPMVVEVDVRLGLSKNDTQQIFVAGGSTFKGRQVIVRGVQTAQTNREL
jgi:hypothetical protein